MRNHFSLSADERAFVQWRKIQNSSLRRKKKREFAVEAETDISPQRLVHLTGLVDGLADTQGLAASGLVFGIGLEQAQLGRARMLLSQILIWVNPLSRPVQLLKAVGLTRVRTGLTSFRFWIEARRNLRKNLTSSDSVADVHDWTHEDLKYGDLMYAHFLRAFKRETVNPEERYFQRFAIRFIERVIFWKRFFDSGRLAGVIVINDDYGPGLFLRLAGLYGLPALRATPESLTVVSSSMAYARRVPYESLRQDFKEAPQEERRHFLSRAQWTLEHRMAGGLDRELAYLGTSQFTLSGNQTVIEHPGKHNIMVATHCFSEAINPFGQGLFPDYWEWLCAIGRLSENPNVALYVKPHPMFWPSDFRVLDRFVEHFPQAKVVRGEASHHALIAQGLKVVATDHGTIATEFPALGIPVVTGTQWTWYRDWGFAEIPGSAAEMESLLLNPPPVNREKAKAEIVDYLAAREWRFSSDSCFFFPELSSEEASSLESSLLTEFMSRWHEKRRAQISERIENFFRTIHRNPEAAIFASTAQTRIFQKPN